MIDTAKFIMELGKIIKMDFDIENILEADFEQLVSAFSYDYERNLNWKLVYDPQFENYIIRDKVANGQKLVFEFPNDWGIEEEERLKRRTQNILNLRNAIKEFRPYNSQGRFLFVSWKQPTFNKKITQHEADLLDYLRKNEISPRTALSKLKK